MTNNDICANVIRSFATVRSALPVQRGQSSELRRQSYLSMAKIDQVSVGLERSMQHYLNLEKELAVIKEMIRAGAAERRDSATGAEGVADKEERDAEVLNLRKDLQKQRSILRGPDTFLS